MPRAKWHQYIDAGGRLWWHNERNPDAWFFEDTGDQEPKDGCGGSKKSAVAPDDDDVSTTCGPTTMGPESTAGGTDVGIDVGDPGDHSSPGGQDVLNRIFETFDRFHWHT